MTQIGQAPDATSFLSTSAVLVGAFVTVVGTALTQLLSLVMITHEPTGGIVRNSLSWRLPCSTTAASPASFSSALVNYCGRPQRSVGDGGAVVLWRRAAC